jgi:hypothetical protein
MTTDFDNLSKEQKIMVMMRKTLTRIIRETTPEPGTLHPLTAEAIEDMRQCLLLISARERELLEEKGIENSARPYYVDEPKKSQVLKFTPRPK